MKKKEPASIEIVASFTGKISVGAYENESPFFSLKEVYNCALTEEEIINRQKFLHDKCYDQFSQIEERSRVEKILKQQKNIRFYNINGVQYPSVTSIIGWDDDFHMDVLELGQYASRGTILHKQAEIYLKTGEWLDPKDIPEVYADYVIVKKGNLNLSLDDVDFRGWYKKHPFEVINLEEQMFNQEYRYAGRRDIKAKFDGAISVMDIKTGSSINKEKAFKQLAAYAKADPNNDVKQMVIIHLNNKTKGGFSNPIISDEIEKYWQLFLKDREIFKQRFNI